MVNPKGVDFSDVQTGNWNTAKPWTVDKIHKWSILIDEYHTLSIFGTSDIYGDTFLNNNNLKNTARLNALKRLIHALITLIRNTRFALKSNKHKTDFDTYKERLKKIEKNIYKLREEKKRGQKVIELGINEAFFEKMMDEINNLIDEVNYRLNFSDLIFTHIEEYDPSKIKQALKDKYINRG